MQKLIKEEGQKEVRSKHLRYKDQQIKAENMNEEDKAELSQKVD